MDSDGDDRLKKSDGSLMRIHRYIVIARPFFERPHRDILSPHGTMERDQAFMHGVAGHKR